MKDRPILFNGAMVRAILAGTKTQTRRPLKHEAPDEADGCFSVEIDGVDTFCWVTGEDQDIHPSAKQFACPYGQPGDRLWVREAWKAHTTFDHLPPREIPQTHVWYLADDGYKAESRTRASMHMPRWASRITLEITSVRVERLTSISEVDAIAEGIERRGPGWAWYTDAKTYTMDPRTSYRDLWESINGPESWAANPWVWVVEFKRVEAST
jgi:hypothetical protein